MSRDGRPLLHSRHRRARSGSSRSHGGSSARLARTEPPRTSRGRLTRRQAARRPCTTTRTYVDLMPLTDLELEPDNWIYLHDPGTRAGGQNFGAWSPGMTRPGFTCLGASTSASRTTRPGRSPITLYCRARNGSSARSASIDPGTSSTACAIRVPRAYPMYDKVLRRRRSAPSRATSARSSSCRRWAATGSTATTTRTTRCGRRCSARSTSSTAPTTTCGRSTPMRSTSRKGAAEPARAPPRRYGRLVASRADASRPAGTAATAVSWCTVCSPMPATAPRARAARAGARAGRD